MRISSPSRKINARNPSHFGSKIQLWPAGNSSIRFASIGSTGGFTGRFTLPSYYCDANEVYAETFAKLWHDAWLLAVGLTQTIHTRRGRRAGEPQDGTERKHE